MESVLPETVRGALRLADRQLRLLPPDDVSGMCAVVRRAATAIGPAETFYVGLYQGDNTLVLPYIFSDGEQLSADTSRFGTAGVSHWIRAHAKPYRYTYDDGRRCHAGAPMGDGIPSRDAVAVPMFGPDAVTVIGMLNTQSPRPNVFDDTFVVALEWLAQALALSLDEGARSSARERLYRDFPELDRRRLDSPIDMLHTATDCLEEVAGSVDTLQSRVALLEVDELRLELGRIKDQCRLVGAELAMMALKTSAPAPTPPDREYPETLTTREREIADLIAHEAMTNAMIGRRLYISEKTVKAHVSSILRKLGIRQRSELVWFLGGKAADRPGAGSGSRN
ncbi:LuxR C-terminal-related transcriptional regulator [Streptomyces cavernicola]|uniref:LuxR C-terminal-related transcriptional regulator n=1 Tax=Streptomyces cavernicola TaxID=3043613 RepID=A0ABT6SAW0_9ACTN|nr:LuxR C-terminal-related transcriptional regulator [Streptomyces sp. B-S-A6]MDI3405075.1 LuxR C-terminal-related transcriptional regulator [Streptomyces sp. B-S-A6]